MYNNDPCANIAHKILIPIVLLLTAGAAVPIYLLKYEKLSHTCTDPFRVMFVTDTQSPQFEFDLYSTVVTVFTYVLPILILPLALPIATLRTCIARQCCVTRYKQPIGELIMTTIVCMIYLGTIVGVVLPRIDEMLQLESVSETENSLIILCLYRSKKYPKVSKSIQKYPKVSKSNQKYPKVSKDIQKYPKVTISNQMYPKVSKSIQRYPKLFQIVDG